MRIQRKKVLLNLKIKSCLQQDLQIQSYDSDFVLLPMSMSWDKEICNITTGIQFPNKLILKVENNKDKTCELLSLSVVGIPINKNILGDKIEYKQNTDFENVFIAPADKTLTWKNNGFAVIDFFHPDPFVYLLAIGNKINVL